VGHMRSVCGEREGVGAAFDELCGKGKQRGGVLLGLWGRNV
jgi:hypothetical protein